MSDRKIRIDQLKDIIKLKELELKKLKDESENVELGIGELDEQDRNLMFEDMKKNRIITEYVPSISYFLARVDTIYYAYKFRGLKLPTWFVDKYGSKIPT